MGLSLIWQHKFLTRILEANPLTPLNHIWSDTFINKFSNQECAKLSIFRFQIYENLIRKLRSQFLREIYFALRKPNIYSHIRTRRESIELSSILHLSWPMGCHFFKNIDPEDIEGPYYHTLCRATDEYLSLMRYNWNTFIDAYSKSMTAPFTQCIIIMGFDSGTNVYALCLC
ncbi:hypothetical protein HZS_3736 [Henneguya salminicola]|nr:hypothetical protein HZS_3736 [Henneguya salminicola]